MFPDWTVYSFLWFILLDVSIILGLGIKTLPDCILRLGLKPMIACQQVVQLIVLGHFNNFWLQNVARNDKSMPDLA